VAAQLLHRQPRRRANGGGSSEGSGGEEDEDGARKLGQESWSWKGKLDKGSSTPLFLFNSPHNSTLFHA